MIADMEANWKLSPIVTELFLREENSTFHFFLYHNLLFKVPKTIIPNATHLFIMKISNKRELQQIASK